MTQCEPQNKSAIDCKKIQFRQSKQKKLLQLKVICLYSTDTWTSEVHACVEEKRCSGYKGAEFEAVQSKH